MCGVWRFGALDKGAQHCGRLRDANSACGSANTKSVAQWEPWHVRDLRLLCDVLGLAGASEKRN